MFEFESEVVEWRGPAPYYFAKTPKEITEKIESSSGYLSYGWGCIPARVTIGKTTITTALIPREGSYFVPLKKALREIEDVQVTSILKIRLELD